MLFLSSNSRPSPEMDHRLGKNTRSVIVPHKHVEIHEESSAKEAKMKLQFTNVYLWVLITAFASSQAIRYRCNLVNSKCQWVIDTSSNIGRPIATAEGPSTPLAYPLNFTYAYTRWFTSRNSNLNPNPTRLPPTNLAETLNISNVETAFSVLNGLGSLGLSTNESVKAANKAIKIIESSLNQSQLSNTDTEDFIETFDEAAKYVEFMDADETKTFLEVSSKALVGSLSKSDAASQRKDVIVKVEEYAAVAASNFLGSTEQNAVSMDLGACHATFCRSGTGECSLESEEAKFQPVEQNDLLVTFIRYKASENDLFPVDSVITSASAQDLSRNKISIPVTFTLKHNQILGSDSSSCVFLNVTTAQWSTDGCEVIDLNEADEFWFNMMTYIGCGVSITSLIATMAIFVVLRLHHAERVVILWNLCFCLCSAQMILVAGTTAQVGTVGCQVIAILLHFFFTASFSWMLMEGVHLYMKASNARGGKYKFKMIIVTGWTLPICIVSISLGIGHDHYGSGNACWLSIDNGFIWAFIGPAIGIIAVNTVVLVFVIKVFLGLKSISKTSERERIKKATKAVLFLMPLLGITWIFGLLAFDGTTKWFLYLFCICNSLQGLAIFILQCAKNDDVRKAFFKKYRRTFVSIGSYSSGASGSSNKTNDSYMSTDHPTRRLPTIAKW